MQATSSLGAGKDASFLAARETTGMPVCEEEDERVGEVLALAKLGYWRWDRASDVLTLSPRTREVLGVDAACKLTWKELCKIVPEAERGQAQRALAQTLTVGSLAELEFRVCRPIDGVIVALCARWRRHVVNGRVRALAGIIEDVTAAKTREMARLDRHSEQHARLVGEEVGRRAESQFQLFVENVVDYAIFTLSPSGIVSNWNMGAERIKGYTASEIIGQNFERFYTQRIARAACRSTTLRMLHAREDWKPKVGGCAKMGPAFGLTSSLTPSETRPVRSWVLRRSPATSRTCVRPRRR